MDAARLFALLFVQFLTVSCFSPHPGPHRITVEVEAGAVWQSRNDVAVPGDTGTRFGFDDLIGSGPFPAGRIEAVWQASERHEVRGLIAPLELSGEGTLEAPVDFAGTTFAEGPDTDGTFRFHSYRVTYRYRFWSSAAWQWRVGVTANVRDAEIELAQGGVSASKTDTGLVPLLHVAGAWRVATDWRIALDADGAVASQGRALDLALKGYWRFADGVELGFGYRTIEGGADNDEVDTFAWIHQAVVSLRWEL